MSIFNKDLVDVALGGLLSHLKDMLEGFEYYTLNGLQLGALNQEYKFKNSKDAHKSHRSNTHVIDSDSDSSSDENKEIYTACRRPDPAVRTQLVMMLHVPRPRC